MTTPYKLITGSDKNVAEFEENVSAALLDGYDLANDLVVQIRTLSNGETETLLFQSLISEEVYEEEEEDEEDEEDEEEDEEEDDDEEQAH